jgi:hypothetical protein
MYEPTFGPYDLMNSPKYTWYTKLIIDNSSTRPFAMSAYPPKKSDAELMTAMAELSRLKFGRPKDIVVAEIMERAQIGATGAPLENDPFKELLG